MNLIRATSVIRFCLLLGLLIAVGSQPVSSQDKKKDEKKEEKKDATPALTSVTSLFPPGAKAGTTVPVVIAGTQLTGANGFWSEHPGITAKLKPEGATDTQVQADLIVAANVPPGLYQYRVLAERGASAPRILAVSSGDSQVEKEPNETVEQAQPLPLEGAVSGTLEKYQDIDLFKITGKSGERVLIVAQSQALGITSDLAIAVMDRQGKPIALGKDFLGGDPYIDFTYPADGEFFVQVWNLTPGDQPGRVYRVTATKTPILQYAFPAGAQRGKASNLIVGALDPANTLGGKPDGAFHELAVPVTIPADAAAPYPFRIAGKNSLNPLPLGVGEFSEINETEPNDEPKQAQAITAPVVVNGRFPVRGDIDHFKLKATKGQKLVFDVESASLGYKGDLVVTVFDDMGKQLAENNDRTPTDLDPRLEFPVPADGEFIVRVQEVVPRRCIGPRFVYRLTVREPLPDFRLTTPSPTVFMKPGEGAVAIDVERLDGFDGDIETTIQGLPGDVKAEPAVVAKGQNKAVLKVTAAPTTNGKHFPITVVGKAKAGDKDVTRVAQVKVPIAKATLVTDKLFLSVNDKFTTPAPPPTTTTTPTPATGPLATIIPASSPGWKYIAMTAVKGMDWIQPNFNDGSWKAAKAPIGYGEDAIQAKQGTVLELTGQTVYFRREFMVDQKALDPKAAFKLLVASDNSAVVWINGKMVDNDTEDHEPLYWNRMVDVPANVFVAGKNVIAVQLNNTAGSSDALIDIQLDGPAVKK